MATCLHCKNKYFNYDNDAGTFREVFCSKECEFENEKPIERYLTNTKSNQKEVGVDLTSENVITIFMDCLFKDGENTSNIVIAEGITSKFRFHQKRLQSHIDNIADMLFQLPKEFQKDSGGGMSFLNACNNADDEQWTDLHEVMEQLFALGLATGKTQCLMPRDMWTVLPGGMPYYVVV